MDGRKKRKSKKTSLAPPIQETKSVPKKLSKVTIRETSKKGKKGQNRTDESIQDSLHGRSSATEPSQWPEEDEARDIKISAVLSRTSFLLQDYREFKAARTIQATVRGWLYRHNFQKRTQAAMIIQRAWRGFYALRYYYRKLEETLQKRIEEHYYHSATLIQAHWRGFWIRENVHDQYRMKRMQMRAAEDLLHCVAFKLHHLLRTRQIPGIYSLRNSSCLSKVEQLLYAMQFKQFNDRVRLARARREQTIIDAKGTHKESAFMTEVPYAGPNFEGVCEPKCCDLYRETDADVKMFKILSLYARATHGDPRLRHLKERQKGQKTVKPPRRITKSDFCSDVIQSMKKWNILGSNKVTINKDVFKCPENVEKFLDEIQSMSNMQARCHCRINVDQLYACC